MHDPAESIDSLRERLKEAYRVRESHTSITYCVECDEVYTGIEPEDCWEHTLLYENQDCPNLSSWIGCLEYLQSEDLV